MRYTDILQIIAANLIWQSALIACVVFIALKVLPRSQVRTRYEIALTGLIGTSFLIAAPFLPKLIPNLSVGIAPPAQETLLQAAPITAPAATEIVASSGAAEAIITQPSLSLPIGFILTIFWILGSIVMFAGLIISAKKGMAWRKQAKPTSASGNALLSKPVDILRSEQINAPLVLGLIRPVILVPKTMILT